MLGNPHTVLWLTTTGQPRWSSTTRSEYSCPRGLPRFARSSPPTPSWQAYPINLLLQRHWHRRTSTLLGHSSIHPPLPGPRQWWALAVGAMRSWHPWGSVGDLANPRATMRFSTRITSQFELSTGTDEGDFSFIFCALGAIWDCGEPLVHFIFFAYIVGFFLAFIDFILFFKVATKESSCHSAPNPPVTCNWSVLHDRRIPHQNSIRQVWASVWLMSDSTGWHELGGIPL